MEINPFVFFCHFSLLILYPTGTDKRANYVFNHECILITKEQKIIIIISYYILRFH